ncbi:MAG TPA: asparagine synthase-related protein, partial [Bryobacteraceae bacterium]|nr:asparagine synthase-related protein [Bryobacteraceae bacterium]
VEAMLAFPGVSCEADLSSIAHLLLDAPPLLGSTGFRDIKLVPAAHILTWSAAGTTARRYWSPDFGKKIRYQREDEYVEHTRELLDEAVRCRLRTLGPVVCQLSGGFDSSGVTATAARLHEGGPVFSITAVPQTGVPVCPTGGRIFVNEWEHASAVAAMHPNVTAYAAQAAAPTYTDPRILFQFRGMPVRNFLNVSWFGTANQMARDLGAKTLLIGSAGNATLSWKGMEGLPDLIRPRSLWALQREVLWLSRQGVQSPWQTYRRNVLPALLPAKLRGMLARRSGSVPAWCRASAISAEFALDSGAIAIAAENTGALAGLGWGDSARLRCFERMWRQPGSSLLRPFYGLERRDPLADTRLVEFCIALPPEQYLLRGVTRRLARRVLADRIPSVVLEEQRVGRQNADWYFRLSHAREQMRASLDRLQRSPLARYALNLGRMRSVLERWPANAADAQACSETLVGVLSRGANIGEFLEWTEDGCPRPSDVGVESTAALFADLLSAR